MSSSSWIIDPIIFSLGPLQVRWYGMMYVLGFLLGGQLAKKMLREKFLPLAVEKIDTLVFMLIIGMFVFARSFYVFVYNWDYYSQNLNELFAVWQGGLSFHGAILGFYLASVVFAWQNKVPIFGVTDVAVTCGTFGIFFGRMGNFINGELFGRTTDVSWGMVFPGGGPYPRHPSQLYEAVLEGLVLGAILWFLRKKVNYYGILSAVFLLGYAVFRFVIEFFREADSQLGYFFDDYFSMGQILCFLQFLLGLVVFVLAWKGKNRIDHTS